jgi:hypothetical protein
MTDPRPVLIGPTDVRLYNRCPDCDRAPGRLCEGIEGVDLLTEVHPARLAVRDWPDVPEPYAGDDHGDWAIRIYVDPTQESRARVILTHAGVTVREGTCEAYRVWTVLAHWTDDLPALETTRG